MSEPNRILIVDDLPRSRQSLKALLATWIPAGQIDEAESSVQALARAGESQPDLVIIDIVLPNLSGLNAIRAIKAMWPRAHIIVLSLYGEYMLDAIVAGADEFVSKGEPPERLLSIIQAALSADADPGEEMEPWTRTSMNIKNGVCSSVS